MRNNKWFGESWGAPACEDLEHAPTPVGVLCMSCSTAFCEHDRGILMWHFGGELAQEYRVGGRLDGPVPAWQTGIHHRCLLADIGVVPRDDEGVPQRESDRSPQGG